MKGFLKFLFFIVLVVAVVLYVPYYLNICDDCEMFFVGAGYEANAIADLFNENEQIICRDCAEKHHAIISILGKDINDYQRAGFVDPVTMFKTRFKID